MTLQNLLAIQRLQAHKAQAAAALKLLQAARRNLADAQVQQISADTRLDAAYKCVMQCATLGLWAQGYRTPTSQPGHHVTAVQSLTLTLGVSTEDVIVLDALRRQRHASDYAGEPVSAAVLESGLAQAAALLAHTEQWLRTHRPDWMEQA